MAYELVKTGSVDNSMPYEFWMDTDADISNLPKDVPDFSIAIAIDTGTIYSFSKHQKKWKIFGENSSYKKTGGVL